MQMRLLEKQKDSVRIEILNADDTVIYPLITALLKDPVVEEVSSPPPKSAGGPYAIATIRVRNWETNRLVREFARALHISRRRIGFAGTKDKRALTTRLFSFENVPVATLSSLRMKDLEVLDAYPSDRPLEI